MKNILFTALGFTALSAFGQINMEDTTVQVVSYWENGEKQNYAVSMEEIKVKGSDSTKQMTHYDVEITVLDSTAKSYTVQWLYKDIKTNSPNATIQKLAGLSKDMKVIYKTDETGVFQEVVNWKELKDFIQKATAALRADFKNIPEMDKALMQMEATFSTKEAIEAASIKDIQQFHSFHGAKYKYGEYLEGQFQAPNIYGGKPFDADMTVYLDEIINSEHNYIVRSTQQVNKEQLTNATYDYLVEMSKKMNVAPPKREDLKDLANDTETASRIHESGWVVYSIQTTTVTSDNITRIAERIIELK